MTNIIDLIFMSVKSFLFHFPIFITLLSAELFLVLVRHNDLKSILKKGSQRTTAEKHLIKNGLTRSFILEILIFVPSSSILLLITIFPLFNNYISSKLPFYSIYALFGILSYGFPFASIKNIITKIALKSLAEFHEIYSKDIINSNVNLDND